MMDNRQKKLLSLFLQGKNNQEYWNSENILNLEMVEYDAYRWYRFMCGADPNNAKGDSKYGKIDSAIANYQLQFLSIQHNTANFKMKLFQQLFTF